MTDRPIMKLRVKLLVPVGLALLGVLAVNLGALWASSSAWRAVDAERAQAHASVQRIQDVEVGFKRQVQEWKNILLRGENQDDLVRYLAQFRAEERAVRDTLVGFAAEPTTPAWAQTELSGLAVEHRDLGRDYRAALDHFQTTPTDKAHEADAMVRGIDRDFATELSALRTRLSAHWDARAASAVTRGQWTVYALLLGSFGLSLLIITLMLSVVHQLIVLPAQKASDFASQMLDPLSADPSQLDDALMEVADDELAQLMQALGSVHGELHEERARLASAQQDLDVARAAAEAAAEAKTAFLARVTHELRTPLHGVVGSLALLREEDMSDEGQQLIRAADESSMRLASLVEDILEFTQVSGEDLHVDSAPFDIEVTLSALIAKHRAQARRAGCALSLEVAQGGPRTIISDGVRLQKVVSELIDNAISATPEGMVVVQLATAEHGALTRVRIDIVDDGPGIPNDLRDAVFQPFAQASEGYDRKKQGAGLGLSMCRRAIHHLGGTLHVEPNTGGGSRFWIELSAPSPEVAAPHDAASDDSAAGPAPSQLLVVGPHPIAGLDAAGLPVCTAPSLDEALLALAEGPVPLALIDVSAVGLGTIEDLRAMADSTGQLTAFVAIARPEDRDLCLADGWDDVVSAQGGSDAIVDVLLRWLDEPVQLVG